VNALQRLIDMPITGKLNLFSAAGFAFLLKSGIATRTVIGGTRVVADAPQLNPLPIPEKDKDRTCLERAFTEGVGSILLTYGILYLIQDVAAKGVQTVDKSLAPQALLEACKDKLNPDQLKQLEAALVKTFTPEHVLNLPDSGKKTAQLADIALPHNAIYHNLYGNGKLAKLATTLANPELLQSVGGYAKGLIADEANHFYRNLNGKGVFCLMLGTAMSAWLSGGPLQAWNDGWFRYNVTEKLLDAYTRFKEQHPDSDKPSSVVSPRPPITPPPARPTLPSSPVVPKPAPANSLGASPWVVAQPLPANISMGGLR
jgi:hypothetical protein